MCAVTIECQLGIPRFAQGFFPMAILRHVVWTAEQTTCPCWLCGGHTREEREKKVRNLKLTLCDAAHLHGLRFVGDCLCLVILMRMEAGSLERMWVGVARGESTGVVMIPIVPVIPS